MNSFKTQEQEIAEHRERLKDRSEEQLSIVIHSKVPHSAEHIAAQQLMDMRKAGREEARHNEIQKKLEELKKPHWTAKYGFGIALIAMIAACIAAYFTIFPRSSQSGSGVQQPLETKQSVLNDFSNSQKQLSSSRQESHSKKQK